MTEVVERVIELFDSTCLKQFESMHCDIRALDGEHYNDEVHSICASISCFSNDMTIRMIVSASHGFLSATLPGFDGRSSEVLPIQQDWCLELANRFLGRLKNKLLSHGSALKMGLPSLVDRDQQKTSLHGGDFVSQKVFQIVDSQTENQLSCALSVDLLNRHVILEDHEDEDEDWFDESELVHL